MVFSTPCPGCGHPITVLQLMLATSPRSLACAGCGSKLRVPGAVEKWWTVGLVLSFVVGLLLANLGFQGTRLQQFLVVFGVLALGSFLASLYLVNRPGMIELRED